MRAAIMQPTYLPWLGYLDLMDQVDVFVLLDDVEFSRQSWQQRNRVRTADGLIWLTVPVVTKGRQHQRILEVEMADPDFVRRHRRILRDAYSRTTRPEVLAATERAMERSASTGLLVEVNLACLEVLRDAFGVVTPTVRSSDVAHEGGRSDRLVSLLGSLGADEYLAPPGSQGYLSQDAAAFATAGIDVLVHEYEHPTYRQLHEPFLPYASALDAALAVGSDAAGIMRSGRRPPSPLGPDEGEAP